MEQKQAYVYLTDEQTGELVRIPVGRLEQYRAAQNSRVYQTYQPSEADKRRLLERLKTL